MTHQDLLVFDGLMISKWGRPVFEAMRQGGVTGVNCTCSVWEGFDATMRNIEQWHTWFRDNADLIVKAHTVADIRQAKQDNRTAIVLGFQNVSAFEDRLGAIQIFRELGVGIAQMAYNTQNLVGTGCYERHDGGLSEFGHDVVAEMNRVGMMCDLSHVGVKTARDVILASTKPVTFSHCLPAALKPHPRNRTDEELRFIADHAGFVGVTMFPPFLPKGIDSTVEDYVAAIEYMIGLVGEESVGIGTDFTEGHGPAFFDWITRDKGYGRKLTEFGPIQNPAGMARIADFPNLTAAMDRAGWSPARVERVMGENWLRVLAEVWN